MKDHEKDDHRYTAEQSRSGDIVMMCEHVRDHADESARGEWHSLDFVTVWYHDSDGMTFEDREDQSPLTAYWIAVCTRGDLLFVVDSESVNLTPTQWTADRPIIREMPFNH